MPDPVANGRFSLYKQPDGGYHIEYKFDFEDDTRGIDIPYPLVRLAAKASGGQVDFNALFRQRVPE